MAANISIARRYARALIDVATEANQLDKIGAELQSFSKSFEESPELVDAFVNPAYDRNQKTKLLESLTTAMQLSPLVGNVLQLLVQRNRLSVIPDVSRIYGDLADARSGRVRGRVTSAVPLSDDLMKKLEQSLEKLTQRNVVLEAKVDPKLIGGVSAQVGSMVIDGSVQAQLEQIRRELREG
jgi:F-type H+-transporting ATPase subunit delta